MDWTDSMDVLRARAVVEAAEQDVLRLARDWERFSHTARLLDAVRALQAADRELEQVAQEDR